MFTKFFSALARSELLPNDAIRRVYSQYRPLDQYKPEAYKGPTYEKIQSSLKKKLFPSVKHLYKQPLLMHEGKMQWLFDHEGKRFLDMFAGVATVSVGHCHPKVVAALQDQIKYLWHTTSIYMHPKIYEFADALTSKLPGDLKVAFFVNSGSEANDLAVLLARLYTNNFDVISLRNSYHGMSLGSMGVTALSTWKHRVPSGPGIHHAMNPDVFRGLWGGSKCRDSPVQTDRQCSCANSCEAATNYCDQFLDILKYSVPKGKMAGFIAESIQGVGGTVQFPKEYLKMVYELVRSNGGVCIADEVQTGFGRTGDHFWGFQMHGVEPDIVTMAKGIGNGFPLAAVITTPKIAQCLSEALYFNTFGGNPLACAVGLAVLNVIEEENTQMNSKVVGTYLLQNLEKLHSKHECIGDVRGKGLMIGVEMVNDKITKRPLNQNDFQNILEYCKDMGVLLGSGGLHGNVFRLKPPMCVTKSNADMVVDVLDKAIESCISNKNTSQ